jgi:1-aminocyclopropane-1-carboxylate deaminase
MQIDIHSMLEYSPTPINELQSEFLRNAGVRLFVKREDLNHPTVSGNKWWKLKYNLEEAKNKKAQTILTFGGAFSNHIFATAAAAHELGLKSIGVIRGEESLPLNKTLSFAKKQGMEILYVSRELYRKKDEPSFIRRLQDRFGDFYLIPEGGTNALAIKGCREFAMDHLSKVEFDYLCLPVGTGGTLAGITLGLAPDKTVIGISVLKDGGFLINDVKTLLSPFEHQPMAAWKILTGYDHGGYAKTSPALLDFIEDMKSDHDLPLDHVYTGKLLFAVAEEIRKGNFKNGSTILILHTGGLQTQ